MATPRHPGARLMSAPNAPWRDNVAVQRRLALEMRLLAMGYTENRTMLDQVNSGLVQLGQPPVVRRTLTKDLHRIRILIQEEHTILAGDVVASVQQLKRESWRILSSPKEKDLMRATALREIREQDQLLARLAGILDERNVLNVGVQVVSQPIALVPGREEVFEKAMAITRILDSREGQSGLGDGSHPNGPSVSPARDIDDDDDD